MEFIILAFAAWAVLLHPVKTLTFMSYAVMIAAVIGAVIA
jgi:hypothetical protein